MSKPKARRAAQKPKLWWQYRRNRNKVWFALLGVLVVATIAGFVLLATQGSGGTPEPEVGQQVEAFELPDVLSGQSFSLANYLGKKDIVLVSYMGFF